MRGYSSGATIVGGTAILGTRYVPAPLRIFPLFVFRVWIVVTASAKNRLAVAEEIQRGALNFQRQNRFAATAGKTDLSLVESHFLCEVDGTPNIDLSLVRERLDVDSVRISRAVASLSQRDLLEVFPDATDRRRKRLRLTAKGAQLLAQIDEESNLSLARMRARILPEQAERARTYLNRLADGLNSPETVIRPVDDPLRPAIRRLTRSMGLLGQNVHGSSGVNSLEWLVLARLASSKSPLSASALCNYFSVPANTMSDLVKRFSQRGILIQERGALETDRRSCGLRLTGAGEELFSEVHKDAVQQFLDGLREFSDEEALDFSRIWAAFVGLDSAPNKPILNTLLQPRIALIRLSSEFERAQARTFFLSMCGIMRQFSVVGEELFTARSICLGLQEEDHLVGVAELLLDSGTGKGRLRNVSITDSIAALPVGRSFLQTCIEIARSEIGVNILTIEANLLSDRLTGELGFKNGILEI
jgi:DNA-binding MarR family transcriptional regulator